MSQPNQENILTAEVEIKGSLKFTNSLKFEGKIEGQVNSEGKFTLGPTGEVKGDIIVQHAIIEGKVTGNVTAKDKVELKANAQMIGDVKASRLVIEEGVVISGKCEVTPEGRKIADVIGKSNKTSGFSELVEKK